MRTILREELGNQLQAFLTRLLTAWEIGPLDHGMDELTLEIIQMLLEGDPEKEEQGFDYNRNILVPLLIRLQLPGMLESVLRRAPSVVPVNMQTGL
jgi:hypothetical protein